ncbi:putative oXIDOREDUCTASE [Mycobacterium ulcerans str. Harvey]|uniref:OXIDOREDUCTASE n=1 Tax=Mycobacterium ulcerans str. Harvey TaxID=1299332 RepID=A0ABP3AKW5_MYCUL|nr:putative oXIDOREDUCTASE [Mycobacterium ulcerans str. Harvey]
MSQSFPGRGWCSTRSPKIRPVDDRHRPCRHHTAKMADFHLRVHPGADAWCVAALAAVLVQENLCDEAFLAEHVRGVEEVPRSWLRCRSPRCPRTATWSRRCPRGGATLLVDPATLRKLGDRHLSQDLADFFHTAHMLGEKCFVTEIFLDQNRRQCGDAPGVGAGCTRR